MSELRMLHGVNPMREDLRAATAELAVMVDKVEGDVSAFIIVLLNRDGSHTLMRNVQEEHMRVIGVLTRLVHVLAAETVG